MNNDDALNKFFSHYLRVMLCHLSLTQLSNDLENSQKIENQFIIYSYFKNVSSFTLRDRSLSE